MTKWKPSTAKIEYCLATTAAGNRHASHRISQMDNLIGRVVAVAGSQMTPTPEGDALTEDPRRIRPMVKVRSAPPHLIGTIRTVNAGGGGSPPRRPILV